MVAVLNVIIHPSMAQVTDLQYFSGVFLQKSRFSSAPQYLCKSEQHYWFHYRDGRDQASILKLNKDLSEFCVGKFDFEPERDKVIGGEIVQEQLEVEILRSTRSFHLYLQYHFDSSAQLISVDTIFRLRKSFPLQSIQNGRSHSGEKKVLWFIPEEKGFNEHRTLYFCIQTENTWKTDSIRILEKKGHLTEILFTELNNNVLRLYLKQYDIRPTEKRAFTVNYSYGWIDVDLRSAAEKITLVSRASYFLSNPCFERLPENKIFLAGLYGTDAKARATGYFQSILPDSAAKSDTNFIFPQFHAFNDTFWTKVRSSQRARTLIRPKQLHNYYIQNFEANPDENRFTYVLQQLYTTDGGSVAGSQLYFHFKDFVIFRTNPLGQLLWFCHVPANQVIYEPFLRFAGSSVFNEGDTVLVFKNEHRRVATKSHARRSMNRPAQGELVMRTIYSEKPGPAVKIQPAFTSGKTSLASSMIKIRERQYLVFFESNHELLPVYIYL